MPSSTSGSRSVRDDQPLLELSTLTLDAIDAVLSLLHSDEEVGRNIMTIHDVLEHAGVFVIDFTATGYGRYRRRIDPSASGGSIPGVEPASGFTAASAARLRAFLSFWRCFSACSCTSQVGGRAIHSHAAAVSVASLALVCATMAVSACSCTSTLGGRNA